MESDRNTILQEELARVKAKNATLHDALSFALDALRAVHNPDSIAINFIEHELNRSNAESLATIQADACEKMLDENNAQFYREYIANLRDK